MTLLSVVLALALTAALAACGSDEPSGVTGPDRTASPPTELGSLSNLTYLALGINEELSGCVPSSLEDQLDLDNSNRGLLPFC